MSKYGNSRANQKTEEIKSSVDLNSDSDILTSRCKFNFHYFDNSNAGQDFQDWTKEELSDLLNKLKFYSENSLEYWKKKPTGGSGNVLQIYGKFPIPAKTDFKEPKYVPYQAEWGRFRLKAKVRLVGFIVPHTFHKDEHKKTKMRWDKNTFYIVFLDKEHKFWKTEND